MLTLGQKIKAIRKEKGLTQAELVEDRITRNQLSLIENGINNPSISTLEFISQRLDVPMSYFLSDDEFSLHKCQKLVTKSEALMESGEFDIIVTEIEDFLNNVNSGQDHMIGDTLGRLYVLLGIAYYNLDKSKADVTLLEAVKYLESTDQISYLAKAYHYLGVIYDGENNTEKAEYYLKKADNIISTVNLENVILKLNIAYNISFLYLKQERYSELIDFINDNMKYSKKYKIYHNFGVFNMLISVAYRYKYNYKQAILCTLKAIEYFQFSEDEYNKYSCYTNLGIYYRLSGDYDNSIKYLDMSKKYFEYTENFTKSINAKSEAIKTLFLCQNDCDSLSKLINEVLYDLNESNENRADILSIKGVCLLEKSNIDEAYNVFLDAEKTIQHPEQSEFITYTYSGLSKIYKHNQEWEKAYTYLDKANALPHKTIKNINFD